MTSNSRHDLKYLFWDWDLHFFLYIDLLSIHVSLLEVEVRLLCGMSRCTMMIIIVISSCVHLLEDNNESCFLDSHNGGTGQLRVPWDVWDRKTKKSCFELKLWPNIPRHILHGLPWTTHKPHTTRSTSYDSYSASKKQCPLMNMNGMKWEKRCGCELWVPFR